MIQNFRVDLAKGRGNVLSSDNSIYKNLRCGFPDSSVGKESTYNAGDPGSIPGLGRSPGEGKGYPLQYSGLENSMDCIVHGVAKSRPRLSDLHFHFASALRKAIISGL